MQKYFVDRYKTSLKEKGNKVEVVEANVEVNNTLIVDDFITSINVTLNVLIFFKILMARISYLIGGKML